MTIGGQGIAQRAPDRTAPGEKPKGGGLSAGAVPAYSQAPHSFRASAPLLQAHSAIHEENRPAKRQRG
jgi:hypothetical protein